MTLSRKQLVIARSTATCNQALTLTLTRKMWSSSGASLHSWYQLYSSFNHCLWCTIHTDLISEFLSHYTVLLEDYSMIYSLTMTHNKSQISNLPRQKKQLGCETHKLSVTQAQMDCHYHCSNSVWWVSDSGQMLPSCVHTDFHDRAFTVLSHTISIHTVASSDCSVNDHYRSRSNTWWLSMQIRSLPCKIMHKWINI